MYVGVSMHTQTPQLTAVVCMCVLQCSLDGTVTAAKCVGGCLQRA